MNLAFKYADLFASKGSPEELGEKIGTLKPEKLKVLIRSIVPQYQTQRPEALGDAILKVTEVADKEMLSLILKTLVEGTGETNAPE